MRVMALDIGGTSIKAGVVTEGRLARLRETPTPASRGGEAVLRLAEEIAASEAGFDRIGVSTAGQVDPETGAILFANENLPGYTGMRVRERLEARFGVPAAVENDVNAAAIGEMQYGAARGERDFLCLTYGTGIGGAVVIGGELYHGSGCSAGEFGHLLTHPGGLPCGCGGRGCYESYASVSALVRSASRLDPSLSSGRAVFARRAEPAVQAVIDAWTREIAYGLVSLIHCFNPACVVLGGGILQEPWLAARLPELVRPQLMLAYRAVRLRPAALGNAAGLLGAAWLAARRTSG